MAVIALIEKSPKQIHTTIMPAPASLLFVESKREGGIGNPQNTDLAQLLQVAIRPITWVLALRPRVPTSLPIRGADGIAICSDNTPVDKSN
jgi:hypothetical protein